MNKQTFVIRSSAKVSGNNNSFVVSVGSGLMNVPSPFYLSLVQACVTATSDHATVVEVSLGAKAGLVDTSTGGPSDFVACMPSLTYGISTPAQIWCAGAGLGENVSVKFRNAETGALLTDVQSATLVFEVSKA